MNHLQKVERMDLDNYWSVVLAHLVQVGDVGVELQETV